MNVLTVFDKRNRTYDFYNKHKMHAVELAVNRKLSKNNNLMEKFNNSWKHPLN